MPQGPSGECIQRCGRQLGIVADTLVVSPDNQAAAEQILKAAQNAAGTSNNKVKLIVTPWLGA